MGNWLETLEEKLPESEFWKDVLATALGRNISQLIAWVFGILLSILTGLFCLIYFLTGSLGWASLSILAVVVVGGLIYFYGDAFSNERDKSEFVEAEIDNITWRWSWKNDSPTDIYPLCPRRGCQIRIDLKDSRSFRVKELEVKEIPLSETARVGGGLNALMNRDRTVALCPKHGQVKEWKQERKEDVIDYVKREINARVREGELMPSSEIG
ncbi:hypothetical protein [Salinibacter ruber]|uniref:hypothetical protein n=1 Tax=Salinibacter ruber TaxID=146919 RepID=UPI002167DBAE|nr:hypothetical protein [Salinibacter ruber]MCS4051428.1 hypothetical protein [Salinibacter ruber]